MMNFKLLLILSLIFLIFFACLPIWVASSYQPKYHYKIRCGGPTEGTWNISDYKQGFSSSTTATTSIEILGNSLRTPYNMARIFWGPITYTFPLSSPGPILLRLHFSPNTSFNNIDPTMFYMSVIANDEFNLLTNFSPYLAFSKAMANPTFNTPITESGFAREFYLHHGLLNLTFSPSPPNINSKAISYGFINGIEIVSLPNDLYLHTSKDQLQYGVPYLNGGPTDYASYTFNYSTTSAMETMFRLNIGGADIQPEQDQKGTGLSRTWFQDTNFLHGIINGTTPFGFDPNMKINYTKATPAYTAPEEVYSTMRIIGPMYNETLKEQAHLSLVWTVEVDGGFNYSFRLHFCEFLHKVNQTGQMIFVILVNNQTASPGFDIYDQSGGELGAPIYRDYVTLVEGAGKRVNLSLQLGLYDSLFYDVILNGLEVFKLGNSYNSLAAPNPIRPFTLLSSNQKNSSKQLTHLVPIVTGSVLSFVLVSFLILGFYCIHQRRKGMIAKSSTPLQSSDNNTISSLPTDLCRRFSLAQLMVATSNFNESTVIGKGGFGMVYKGTLHNDGNNNGAPLIVAIKRLDPTSKQGYHEFLTEIKLLSSLRHINLVSLIGYCKEEREMMLVYEYMPCGTLQDHLLYKYTADQSNTTITPQLSWKQRLKISLGSAKGLHYLHEGVNQVIIHRDVKSTNILLDHNWTAKVSDFGLSKIVPPSICHVSTAVKGSFGYLDPEYFRSQRLTHKSDVYSFGVVLFEILCGRPALNTHLPLEQMNLALWARSKYNNGILHTIVDPKVASQIAPECLSKYGETAEKCTRDYGWDRPSMGEVVQDLKFALELQEIADTKTNVNIDVAAGLMGSTTNVRNDDMFTTAVDICWVVYFYDIFMTCINAFVQLLLYLLTFGSRLKYLWTLGK